MSYPNQYGSLGSGPGEEFPRADRQGVPNAYRDIASDGPGGGPSYGSPGGGLGAAEPETRANDEFWGPSESPRRTSRSGGGPGRRGPGGRGPGGPGGPGGHGKDKPVKTGWRRYVPNWKFVVGGVGLCTLGAVTLVAVGYMTTPTPSAPKADVTNAGSRVYYSDGKTQITLLGAKRELLTQQQMGDKVRYAAMAAEDMGFMTESGISPRGMARALWNTATGTQTQGGSTITQQLARNYYQGLSQQRSVSRKFREIFASIKLSQNLSHDQILTNYLNTIDFGRQSSGVGQAAHSYFGKEAGTLDWGQAAMLAAMIQQPGYFHTQKQGATDPAYDGLVYRWHYVLNNLVKMKQITQADADAAQFPKTTTNWDDSLKNNKGNNQLIYLKSRISKELTDAGITEAQVENQGYKIVTSLNPTWMKYAQQVMDEHQVSDWKDKKVRVGLIAVDPKDGSIKAFYGGNGTEKQQVDSVFTNGAQVGSSFKPYVLATALKNGYNVKSMISGASPQTFAPDGSNLKAGDKSGYTVHNDSGDGKMGVIDLTKATAMSVNTAYVKLGLILGTENVAATAESLGVPQDWLKEHIHEGGLALGIANISAAAQASGYAAFANGGYAVQPHVLSHVYRADGSEVELPWQKNLKASKAHPVLTQDQAAQMTYAMRAVVEHGTASRAALPDRAVAGKTGTTEGNHAGWFVGFPAPSPVQLSAAVAIYNTNAQGAITGIPGVSGGLYGGTVPAEIWRDFMEKVDNGSSASQFTTPTFTGTKNLWDTPSATPTAPTTSPTATAPSTCGNNGRWNQQQNCTSSTPTAGSTDVPCQGLVQVPNCNPDIPPTEDPWLTQWCQTHPFNKACRKKNSTPTPSAGANSAAQSKTLARLLD